MKKYIPHVLLLFLYASAAHSQSMHDLLRFTRPELKGTARYISLGGAFNALGGDLSAIKDNPAAAAVFINSELGVTLNAVDNKIDASYFGNQNSIDSRSSKVEQFGIVLVLNDTEGNDFSKIALAFNYQNDRIYDNKYNAIGINPNRGLDDYFLAYANGVRFQDIKTYDDESISDSYRYLGEQRGFSSQQAFLGYQSYVINPEETTDENTLYVSNSNPQGNSVNHDLFVSQSGRKSKYSFTLSTQYKDKLYLGLNLNSHQLETRRVHNLLEDNYGAGSDFSYAEFENDLYTYGSGFSFQLGAIYKPTDKIRMGLSYQSPTWYSLTDELSQFIITSENNETDTIDPGVINIYEYKFSTPAEMSAGLAYIFGKNGLISAQYDLSNYQNTSFNINQGDVNFINQNNEIASNLKSAGTLKLGGEYRISRFSIRAGYFNQKSIHKAFQDSYNGSSIGIGYDFGGSALNLALSRVESQKSEPLFDSGLTDLVGIKNNQSQFLISYSVKL